MDALDKLMAKPHLEGAKAQHYVSRFYLAGFARNDNVSVFDRRTGHIRPQTPDHTGRIPNLYTFEDHQGRRRYDLENLFGYHENLAAAVILKLSKSEPIDALEREQLIAFLALAAVRTPTAIADIQHSYGAFMSRLTQHPLYDEASTLKMLREVQGPDLPEDELRELARKVFEGIRNDSYKLDVDPGFALKMSINFFGRIAKCIWNRDWTVMHRPSHENAFLTTDSPVVLTHNGPEAHASGKPIGYASLHALILFPLDESCGLVLSGNQGKFRHAVLSSEKLREYNLEIAINCQCYVIGSQETLVRSITDELGLAGTEWASQYVVR